jgi:hypothetical protein
MYLIKTTFIVFSLSDSESPVVGDDPTVMDSEVKSKKKKHHKHHKHHHHKHKKHPATEKAEKSNR